MNANRWIWMTVLTLGACNSSAPHGSPDTGSPAHDAGNSVGNDAATLPHDAGTMMSVDSGGTMSTDAGCSAVSTLHPPHAGSTSTIYCPFGMGDAGALLYCTHTTQHCCEPSAGTATCQPTATACGTGDVDWQCQDPGDCATGQHCCGTGTFTLGGAGCGNFASGFHGTHCAATCAAGTEIQMCTSDGQCASGSTCQPFRARGAQVGACH